jgi:caspase domain-containing protein
MSNRRLALVAAIDRYDQPALLRLASPGADAAALADVLGDPELGGFEVEVLRNPTSSTLGERVERMLIDRHPSDLVLLHFSCHGLKDDAGELYLAATNTVPDLLGSTAVEAAWVSRVMQRSRAQRVVLLLDCCYGGAFERGLIRRSSGDVDVGDQFRPSRLDEGRGRVVITASTAMEYAFEGAELTDEATTLPSIFTGALVDGIRSGEADRNQDGRVSLGELYDFVYDRVRERTPNQTPSKWEFGLRGDLLVSRNPHRRVRAVSLAPELLDLIKHPLSSGRRAAVRELTDLAAGEDLARAAAARSHLAELAKDDSRAVTAEAIAALAETGVRLAAETLDLGSVKPGNSVTREVAVLGGPLALTSTVSAGESLLARLDGSSLRVTWTPHEVGTIDEAVTVDGPAGTAEVRVTGQAAAPKAEPKPEPEPTPEPAAMISAASVSGEPVRRKLAILASAAAVLLLAAAIALVAIVTNNRNDGGSEAHSTGSPTVTQPSASPPTTRATTARSSLYPTLLTKLPAKIKDSCNEDPPGDGEVAVASCGDATYRLWQSEAVLKDDFADPSPKKSNCANPPPADENRIDDSSWPEARDGQLSCWFYKNSNPPFYAIEWGLFKSLVTCTYISIDVDPKNYPQLYRKALADLKAMP